MATLSLTGILGPALVWAAYLLLVRDGRRFKATGRGDRRRGHRRRAPSGARARHPVPLCPPRHAGHLDLLPPERAVSPDQRVPRALSRSAIRSARPTSSPAGTTTSTGSTGSQTNVDNTLLMIVFYFGLLGILLNAAYVLKAAQFLVLRRHAVGLIMLSLLIAREHDRRRLGAPFRADDRLRDRGRPLPACAERCSMPQLQRALRSPFTRRRSAGPPARAAPRAARSPAASPRRGDAP